MSADVIRGGPTQGLARHRTARPAPQAFADLAALPPVDRRRPRPLGFRLGAIG